MHVLLSGDDPATRCETMTRPKHTTAAKKHPRKRKEAKAHGKKDPGVPQLLGFKEYAKKEAELKQKRVAALRTRQEAARLKETSQRRSLDSLQQDALRKQRDFEQKEAGLQQLQGHPRLEKEGSRRAYYREFRKVIQAADVVLEVLDARDPQGCRCPQVEEAVLQAGGNKKLVLVLNKIDLVSKEVVAGWLKYLRNELPTVAFKASTQQQSRHLQQSKVPVARASCELLASAACLGADCLLKVLANYSRSQDLKTAISVGVVGFPNVGKSSLINSLKRSRACSVGATPGVTKCLQEVQLDRHVKLLDCPGLVLATAATDAALVLRSCLKVEQVADPVTPVDAILRRCSKEQIMQHYGVPAYRDVAEFLAHLARRKGKLRKGGVPDHEKAAKAVLSDWMSGKISYFTHPPETHTLPTHISAEIVTEMGRAFDFEALEQGNQEALADLPSVPVGIGLAPAGLTSGAGAEMEEEETAGEEETAMDEDRDLELGTVTVELKAKNKAAAAVAKPVPRAPSLEEISALDPLHQGQGLRAASRRRKKQQKRAEKIASKLSATLTAAMNFGTAGD
ncbi:guanine nucleotide-binding protein-like 3-like protein isoform X1 [Mauremys mutica]|uniref:guanine nucleotide-binding protein-like 3-like protein isoform X1 n=2 Tax=Mauremys mutica TaxID=74926 RepID=UPI001D147C11|nr:guanine nucleotide-binding protein-like 3-like protein isoform X1 [Mauremys mutica]